MISTGQSLLICHVIIYTAKIIVYIGLPVSLKVGDITYFQEIHFSCLIQTISSKIFGNYLGILVDSLLATSFMPIKLDGDTTPLELKIKISKSTGCTLLNRHIIKY